MLFLSLHYSDGEMLIATQHKTFLAFNQVNLVKKYTYSLSGVIVEMKC